MFNSPLLIVARFEVKTLLRSWFFRIFSAIVILFLLFFNLMANTKVGDTGFNNRMLVGGLPYMNLWVLNIVQSIIAVFLSSDFLSRDKKLDTTEVIYVRSMSNFEYVFGKTLGILYVFGGLNLLVLLFTFITNIVSPDAGFSLITYLVYPFIISLPTLIFVLGLSFLTMQLIKNQAITFILILGYIATCLFYLRESLFGLTDFLAFYTPLAYSSYVGFGNIEQLIFVRGGYMILGIALMFFAVAKLPRLSQTTKGKSIAYYPAYTLLVVALFVFGFYYLKNDRVQKQISQQKAIELNLPLDAGFIITHYDIDIEHLGNSIKGEIVFNVQSTKDKLPSKLNFYFNNGLDVASLKIGDKLVDYSKNLSFLKIDNFLDVDSCRISISFSGEPNQNLAYFDLDEEKLQLLNRFDPLIAAKKYMFVSSDYLLLTKEILWYPIVAERNAFRINHFFTSNVKVKGLKDLTYLSQGEQFEKDGYSMFKGDAKYSKLSLVGSSFEKKEISVDSIKYQVLLNKENWFYDNYFTNLKDTLPDLIRRIKGDYERKLSLKFPYKRLSFIEVPVHFYTYYRPWMLTNENSQPEMILVPEKGMGINQFNLSRRAQQQEKQIARDGTELLPVEKESELFTDLIGNSFALPEGRSRFFGRGKDSGRSISDWSAYSVFPLFYTYSYSIEDKGLPYLNMCLENYMLSRIHNSFNRFGSLSGNDKSILFLKQQKEDLVSLIDKENKKISVADIILTVGNTRFALAQQSIGVKRFDSFVDSLLDANKWNSINSSDLNIEVPDKEHSASEKNNNGELELPAFLFGESTMYEVQDRNRKRYFISLEVANKSDVDGLIQVSLLGGSGGSRRNQREGRGGPPGDRDMTPSFKDVYKIEKGKNVKVGILVNRPPRMMSVHTFLSENVPSDIRFPLADFEEGANNIDFFSGIRELNYEVQYCKDNEIIVDNEDEGFSVVNTQGRKTLRELIQSYQEEDVDDDEFEYKTLRPWRPEGRWTPVLNSSMHGKYVKSIMYKKSGDGSGKVQFVANLPKSGKYKVYAMMPSSRMGSFRGETSDNVSYLYKVYHDDGVDEISVPIENESSDWYELGVFYFSEGEAKVELSDLTTNRVVVADAVKWIKL